MAEGGFEVGREELAALADALAGLGGPPPEGPAPRLAELAARMGLGDPWWGPDDAFDDDARTQARHGWSLRRAAYEGGVCVLAGTGRDATVASVWLREATRGRGGPLNGIEWMGEADFDAEIAGGLGASRPCGAPLVLEAGALDGAELVALGAALDRLRFRGAEDHRYRVRASLDAMVALVLARREARLGVRLGGRPDPTAIHEGSRTPGLLRSMRLPGVGAPRGADGDRPRHEVRV